MTDNDLYTLFDTLKSAMSQLSNEMYGQPENIQAIKDWAANVKIYRVQGDCTDTTRYGGKLWWTHGTLSPDKCFFETTDLNEAYQEKTRREVKVAGITKLFFQVVEYAGQEC